jgi:hypothetical protein
MWWVWRRKTECELTGWGPTRRCLAHRGTKVSLLRQLLCSRAVAMERQTEETHWSGSLIAGVWDTKGTKGVSLSQISPAVCVERQTELRATGRGPYPSVCGTREGGRRCLYLAKYSPAVSVERQTQLRPAGRATPHVCYDALGQHHSEQERSCSHWYVKTIRGETKFYSYVLKR